MITKAYISIDSANISHVQILLNPKKIDPDRPHTKSSITCIAEITARPREKLVDGNADLSMDL